MRWTSGKTLAFQNDHRTIFIHGFSKKEKEKEKEKENVSPVELRELRRLAIEFLSYNEGNRPIRLLMFFVSR